MHTTKPLIMYTVHSVQFNLVFFPTLFACSDALLITVWFNINVFIQHLGLVKPVGNWNGKMQIIHEGGYNRLLSEQFIVEFPKRYARLINGKI